MDPISQLIHLEDLPTPGSRFELQELLGEGTYSRVYAAMDKQKGNRVAIKIINDIAENIVEIESEYVVLSTVGGQSLIPKYHGTYLQGKNGGNRQLWFVMELCEGVPVSELLSYLRNEGKPLNEDEIAVLMKSFMMAIQHLHKNEIIYRDVRSSNFILSPSGEVKLIDFGTCSLVKDTDGQTHSSIGTPYWMAPEVISCEQDKHYTKVCDVWSLGITAIELAEHQPPLYEIHPVRAMFQIARNPPPTLKKMAAWTEPFKDFITECLERNPENRPSLMELMLHPFIQTIEDSVDEENQEEKLSEDYVHTLGDKAKEILKRLGEMVESNLYPLQPSKPMTVTVKNWHFKAEPDAPHFKQLPDDLAALDSVTEESALEHLLHRFNQDEIYSYIGDILLAVNPRVPLPLFDSQIQMQYWEKARSDNAPHVFAIADRAYQQMLHHKQSQVILLLGKWSSGKSFSATQIVNQLAYLCPGGNVAMAEKIQQLGPLLDAFGSAKTTYNSNASRLLKTVSITFTKTGKTTGAIINATLLDRIRISNTPEGECNFHILYYIYDGLKAEKRLTEFGLDKLSAMRYMPLKTGRNQDHSVTAYKGLYHAFRILSYTEEEILLILRILSAILLLGDVTYTMKGSMATANNPYLISQAAKNLSVDNDRLFKMIGTGPEMEDLMKKRDGWVQFLYVRLFDWIVSSVNATLSFSRAVMGSVFSVTVIDYPGFGTSDPNPVFRLGCNIIDDYLQNHIQQLMFFKELDEYKEENVDIPFNYEETIQQKQNRNELIECEKTLLNAIQDTDQWSSLAADCITVDGDTMSVNHVFEKVDYSIPDIQAEDLTIKDEAEYLDLFQMTDDKLTSAVATHEPSNIKPLGEEIVLQLDKINELLAADYPHLVLCLLPTESLREDIKYEPEELLKQLRAFNFLETIIIRQQGFARRVTFSDFLNRYRYLAFDFDEEVELTKENSQLLLIRLKMDGWAIGSNKVFLKYFTEEYLTRLYEMYVKKLVKIQAMARRFIVKLRSEKNA